MRKTSKRLISLTLVLLLVATLTSAFAMSSVYEVNWNDIVSGTYSNQSYCTVDDYFHTYGFTAEDDAVVSVFLRGLNLMTVVTEYNGDVEEPIVYPMPYQWTEFSVKAGARYEVTVYGDVPYGQDTAPYAILLNIA